ncbi:MAG: hypothetical protein ABWJ98_06215 [Hydrogenothermaceae bacterium]
MKTRKNYYTPPKVFNLPVVENPESDWWIAKDIQKEISVKYGRYVSLSVIGKVAKMLGKSVKTSYGFNLYHRSIVDYFGNN